MLKGTQSPVHKACGGQSPLVESIWYYNVIVDDRLLKEVDLEDGMVEQPEYRNTEHLVRWYIALQAQGLHDRSF